MKTAICLGWALLLSAGALFAQSGFDYTSKSSWLTADPFALPDKAAYARATQSYLERYGNTPGSGDKMLQMGDNYRMNGMPVEAALWYSRGIDQARSPEDHLHLAQVLKMVGQCEEANNRYRVYLRLKGISAGDLCTEVETGEWEYKVTMEHLPYVNSAGSDFAATPWGDRLLFTTDREFTRPGAIHDSWTMRNFTSMFYAERDKSGQWRSVKRLRDLDGRFHDGAAVLDPGGSILYFTRSHASILNNNGMRDLSLHAAVRKGNGWAEKGLLPFSVPNYATAHPAMTTDGQVLVFSSDMPGGYGGMDLYRVVRQSGVWGRPENLGPEINSQGNELFPSISADGYLFYASDGLAGFGGLDVFAAAPEEDGTWRISRNLGQEINSSYDDFALYPLPGRRSGYMSTNRPGGLGLDDIYAWTSDKPLGERGFATGELLVLDAETQLPVANARIQFGKQVLSTNNAGRVRIKSTVFGPQTLRAEADGFMPATAGVELPSQDLQTIRLVPAVYQPFLFQARDINTQDPVTGASYEVFEFLPGGQMLPVNRETAYQAFDKVGRENQKTDAVTPAGKDIPWILDARKRYQVRAKAEGYLSGFLELTAPAIVGNGPLTWKMVDLEPLILGIKEEDLTEGASFRLDGIYYDYNKADIRLDARGNLDELARLMTKYPGMMIELSSHTDSRGNDFYNLDLSQRRADAAIEYLNRLGIAADRMVARGYGERKPVNKCKDGVKCQEDEHQLNRRTEFRIIKM